MAASRATLEQEIQLRSLTAHVVGPGILQGYRRVAIVTFPDRICSAFAAALAAAHLAASGYREGAVAIYTYEEGREADLARRMAQHRPDAVYIAFGGEQRMSQAAEAARRLLSAMADAGLDAAVVIHVRTWLATRQLSNVLADPRLRDYLASRELRVFTADVPGRRFHLHRVKITPQGPALEKYAEAPMTEEHAKLLSTSLPPPE